jgi:Zn-dependent peptidase ImmA (M78 family)
VTIPKKVRVLFKEYTIEEQINLHDEEGELYGQIDFLQEKILLNAEASEEAKKATLIHEIVHALDEMYKIGLEEEQVEKLGNALYMLYRDNKELFSTCERGDAD